MTGYAYIDEFGEYCETYTEYRRKRNPIKQYKKLPNRLKGIRYFLYDNKVKNIHKQNDIIFQYWFEHLNCYFNCKTEDQLFIQIAEVIQLDFVKFVRYFRSL